MCDFPAGLDIRLLGPEPDPADTLNPPRKASHRPEAHVSLQAAGRTTDSQS